MPTTDLAPAARRAPHAPPATGKSVGHELVIDWIKCDGFGLCGDLAPDLIGLDDWRYPILPAGPIPSNRMNDARRIVDCCPVKALTLRRAGTGRRG